MAILTNNLCIGLTGSIGSGKTTACEIFQSLGADIINADKIAHNLLTPKSIVWNKIYTKFGDKLINPDQTINKNNLRLLCVQDQEIKQWLESIMHPMINKLISQIIINEINYYYIIELPLLFEATIDLPLHRTICINTSHEQQIQRLKARNKWSEAEACSMINLQMDKNTKAYLADDNIDNSSDINNLKLQIKQLHNFYKTLCPKKIMIN